MPSTAKMKPAEIKAIGTTLYGEAWQAGIAKALGVDTSTVRRWMQIKPEINPTARVALRCLFENRPKPAPAGGGVLIANMREDD